MKNIQVVNIESWGQFRGELLGTRSIHPTYWRGQSDASWPLASSFERMILRLSGGWQSGSSMRYPYDGRLVREGRRIWNEGFVKAMRDRYLAAFKQFSHGLRGANPQSLSEDEWWALGRHYGLITPLLDWTDRPYIAAHFALLGLFHSMNSNGAGLSYTGKKAAVFRLMHADGIEDDGFRVLRPGVEELGRMHNQRGLFTRLDSEDYFELESYLESRDRAQFLTKFVLSDQVMVDGLKEFAAAGIDSRLIYPDLHGAALAANEHYALGSYLFS